MNYHIHNFLLHYCDENVETSKIHIKKEVLDCTSYIYVSIPITHFSAVEEIYPIIEKCEKFCSSDAVMLRKGKIRKK